MAHKLTQIIAQIQAMYEEPLDGSAPTDYFLGVPWQLAKHAFICTDPYCELQPDDLHAEFVIQPTPVAYALLESALGRERVDPVQVNWWVNARGVPYEHEAMAIATYGDRCVHLLLCEPLFGEEHHGDVTVH